MNRFLSKLVPRLLKRRGASPLHTRLKGVPVWCVLLIVALPLCLLLLGRSYKALTEPDAPVQISASIDLGEIEFGQVVASTLTVSNPTRHPVEIRGVESSCVCLTVGGFPKTIAPGGTGKIELRIAAAEVGEFDFVATTSFKGRRLEVSQSHLLHTVVKSPAVVARQEAEQEGLLIPASEAIQKMRLLVLIDIRDVNAFTRASVPGAQNFPLFALKTKNRLKNSAVVLMADGMADMEIYEECRKLRKLGFANTRVLDGGIRAWKQAGGMVEGTSRIGSETGLVNAWRTAHSQEQKGWDYLKINLTNEPTAATTPVPLIGQVSYSNDPAELRASLAPYLAANPRRLMVVAPDDAAYSKIEEALKGMSERPVFYLSGGFSALVTIDDQRRSLGKGTMVSTNNYDNQQTNAGRTSGVRLSGCGSCAAKK